jgi:flagellum-specific ATP synthase
MPEADSQRAASWRDHLAECRSRIEKPPPFVVEGRLTRMVGLTLEAAGCQAPIGARCLIFGPNDNRVEAEVVGFAGDKLFLMPTGPIDGLMPNARVIPHKGVYHVGVGESLLGRVLNDAGEALDGKGPPHTTTQAPLIGRPINPLERDRIQEPLDVGVRAINALFTVGRGQRLGLFAGSGVGKSVLLGMMTKFTSADVIVVGLIGERGREVKEFIDNILREEGLRKAVVIAAPADYPPLRRIHGALVATTIAEYFRDCGANVLLLMDSLTRFAQASREITLAIGEPPATKGFPPSVFARLPQLVERAGNGSNGGSITAFYTVLTEGDELNDPVAESARAILDGHIVLSRSLADAGHYPAIDIEASISRAMNDITEASHQQATRRFRHLYSTYQQHRDLINIGGYTRGADPRLDEAIDYYPRLQEFLRQDMHQRVPYQQSREMLAQLIGD